MVNSHINKDLKIALEAAFHILLRRTLLQQKKLPLQTKVEKYPSSLQVTLQNNSILKRIVMFGLLVFQDALLM